MSVSFFTTAEVYGFFFSSRRRHTRLQGDWSSDVCSSDLGERAALAEVLDPRRFDLLLVAGARQFLPRFGKQCVDPIDHLDTPSGTTKAAPVPRRGLVANCSKAYAAARLTIAANACGSTTAMSASTLRSSAIFAFFKPAMKRE